MLYPKRGKTAFSEVEIIVKQRGVCPSQRGETLEKCDDMIDEHNPPSARASPPTSAQSKEVMSAAAPGFHIWKGLDDTTFPATCAIMNRYLLEDVLVMFLI